MLLFAQMREGESLTEERITELKDAIAQAHSKRHVPAYIFPVQAVPVTLTGKKTEIAIKSVVCGQVGFKPSSVSEQAYKDSGEARLHHHPHLRHHHLHPSSFPCRPLPIPKPWMNTGSTLILREC